MSALGQKRTLTRVQGMSALTRKRTLMRAPKSSLCANRQKSAAEIERPRSERINPPDQGPPRFLPKEYAWLCAVNARCP
jgi:hypothetical protein